MRKGYEISENRRRELASKYHGFGRISERSPALAARWAVSIHGKGTGAPGLTVHHPSYPVGENLKSPANECESKGLDCDEREHDLVYRDHRGRPVAYAEVVNREHDDGSTHQTVDNMASNLRRGVQHAIAVGHIANHLGKMGVEPSGILSGYSQRLVSHGDELQGTKQGSRLQDYLERRAARIRKGYKLTPEGRRNALMHAHAAPYYVHEPDQWVHDELSRIPNGEPGLTFHRNLVGSGGGWGPANWAHSQDEHSIVYRDGQGKPVTLANVQTHDGGVPLHQPKVTQMVSDRSRGTLHAIGVAHVSRVLNEMGVGAGAMTNDSQRLVAHGLDLGPKRSKLLAYIDKRAARKK